MKRHPSRTRGLFGRLLFIFVGLILGMILSFVISFKLFNKDFHREMVHKNIQEYVNYIVSDIGTPPSIEIAERKAKSLGLNIGVFAKDFIYKSSPNIPGLEELKKDLRHKKKRYSKKHHVALVEKGGYTYVLGVNRSLIERSLWPIIIAILSSLLFVVITYHLVERMFKPLYDIKETAEEYANGNLSYKFPLKGRGLLLDLSRSIQNMGEKIEFMLSSQRELLLAIAHEIRTPITRAKLHLEFVEDEEVKKKLSQELDEMSKQVSDILEAERLKGGHHVLSLKETNLGELIDETVQRYFIEEKNISLEVEKNISLNLDSLKYSLVIKNLLSNAIRHGQGKPIQVRLSKACLEVIDHGDGIPKNEISAITEAFYRVDKSRERKTGGVGLGLHLVAKILEAHGHQFEVESQEKTVFRIKF